MYFQNIFQRNFRIIYISNIFRVMKINHFILENTDIKFKRVLGITVHVAFPLHM